jgi:Ser-tRNA(Ala) deacylase AlaX
MTKQLFLEDSYATECEATIREIDGEKVVLDQTVFYPTGGGQEHDTGVLQQGERSFEVYQVKKENGKIVHFVKDAAELRLGRVNARINWDRRYGLMRHHSLLHVLGSVVYKKYGALCTGNQIYQERARIDFNELRELSKEELEDIVGETNKILKEGHPISSRYVSRGEAESIPGLIKTVVSLLPSSITEVRLVTIGSIDEQACGGTHVKNTAEIGQMVIHEVKSKGKNNKRFEVSIAR